jgi:hypothetical protein
MIWFNENFDLEYCSDPLDCEADLKFFKLKYYTM